MFAPQCPQCGYPLDGLPGLTCPECGYTRPPPTADDPRARVEQVRAIARQKGLRCRKCNTGLDQINDQGECAGCGLKYDFPDGTRSTHAPHDSGRHAPRTAGWIVVLGFAGVLAIAIVAFFVLIL